MGLAVVPTIEKLEHSKSGYFCLDFKWFMSKWQPFVRILIGLASKFQIPLEIQTICNLTFQDRSKSRLVQISDPYCTYVLSPK